MTVVKQMVLRVLARAGYVVMRKSDYDRLCVAQAKLEETRSQIGRLARERYLRETRREARQAQARSDQEIEQARAENWELRQQLKSLKLNRHEPEPIRSDDSELKQMRLNK